MKTCRKCNETKPLSDFGKDSREKDGLHNHCKVCYNIRKRKWHRTSDGEAAYQKARGRAANKKLRAIEYKGGKCEDCGGEFHISVFEFHHKDPKEKDGSPAALRNYTWERYKAEIDKCALLCANCHRLRHWKQSVS
jgi:hypothetical protein